MATSRAQNRFFALGPACGHRVAPLTLRALNLQESAVSTAVLVAELGVIFALAVILLSVRSPFEQAARARLVAHDRTPQLRLCSVGHFLMCGPPPPAACGTNLTIPACLAPTLSADSPRGYNGKAMAGPCSNLARIGKTY